MFVSIYRIEHIERKHGPYKASFMHMDYDCMELASRMGVEGILDRCPPPHSDGIPNHGSEHYCGFDSMEALLEWFDPWLDELERCGYHVAVFRVESRTVLRGEKQVMFPREGLDTVESIPIGDLLVRA